MNEAILQFSQLTAEKQAIINKLVAQPDAAIMVDAIAGSGKTTLLAHAALKLVQGGMPIARIGIVTVSNTAANHLNDVMAVLAKVHGVTLPRAKTIHSACFTRLQDCFERGFSSAERLRLLRESDQALQDALRQSVENAQPQALAEDVELPHPSPANLQSLLLAIERVKGERRVNLAGMMAADELPPLDWLIERTQQPAAILLCLMAFERIRERQGFITFADLPIELIRINRSRTDARIAIGRYEALLVDEANDLNPALLEAILLTRRKSSRVVLVGDRHQCVLSSAGASSKVLAEDMPRLVDNVAYMPLSASHRFGDMMARRLRALPGQAESATAFRSATTRKTSFSVKAFSTAGDICDVIAQERKKQPDWTIAVLWRQRAEAVATEFALIERAQHYTMVGHKPVTQEPLVMGLIGMLLMPAGLLDDMKPQHRADLTCAAARLFFPLWDWDSEKASRNELVKQDPTPGVGLVVGRWIFESAERLSLSEEKFNAARQTLVQTYLDQAVANAGTSAASAPVQFDTLERQLELRAIVNKDNVDPKHRHDLLQTLDALKAFCASQRPTLRNLRDLYVKACATAGFSDVAAQTPGSITLSSFLRIKGMERDTVIIGDASDDKVPLRPNLTNPLEDTREHATQERNLLYVAVTRAKHAVIALYQTGKQPSRLIDMMRGKAKAVAPEPVAPVVAPPVQASKPEQSAGEGKALFKALVAKLNEQG